MITSFRKKRPPYGFTFLDAETTQSLEKKTRAVQQLLKENGFERVMPASLDYPDTFTVFESSDYFRMRDHLGEDLALRNDVTVQVIKGYANQLDHTSKKQKLFYTVPVFKDMKKNYPAAREVYQVGAEVIGAESDQIIPELIQIADHALRKTLATDYRLLIGDIRSYLLLEQFITDRIMSNSANKKKHETQKKMKNETVSLRSALIGKNVPLLARILGRYGFNFTEKKGVISGDARDLALVLTFKPEDAVFFKTLDSIAKRATDEGCHNLSEKLQIMFQQLQKQNEQLQSMGIESEWEPVLLRKARYYTGFLFEGYVAGASTPPLRGGSYDTLVSEYSDENMPASGFALDMSALV